MEYMDFPYQVWVLPNKDGYITAVNSSAFLSETDGWVEIDEGYGDRYHHAQANYFPASIQTKTGVYRYRLTEGMAEECTPEEITAQEQAAGSGTSSVQDDIDALLIDHEYRLTLLELNLSE